MGTPGKKHSNSMQSGGPSQETADNSQVYESWYDKDEPPVILKHYDGRPISVPEKFLVDFRDKEGSEIEKLAARKMAEKATCRKRGVPKYYLYDFNALNERPVDKFRLSTKSKHETNATVKFVGKHN